MSDKRDVSDATKANPEGAKRALFDAPGEPMPTADQEARKAHAAELAKYAPPLSAILPSAVAVMRARADKTAKPVPLPWANVAAALGGGLWPGLHVLTGATGQGKTQLALQAAFRAAVDGVPVLYLGLELGEVDIVARLMALAAGEENGGHVPPWSKLYFGTFDGLAGVVQRTTKLLQELPFHVEFGPPHGWDFNQLDARVAALREANPEPTPGALPLFVVLDFLQAVGSPPGERLELRERIGRAAYAGRAVARKYGATVLLLSSVSRENARALKDEGTNKEAHPSDFVGMGKESGDIEYAADTVLALVRGEWSEKKTPMRLAVAKMRAGPPAWCELDFNGSTFSVPLPQSEPFTVGRK